MPNTLALAKNYTNLLDEVYQAVSVTTDLTGDANMMRAGANVNEILYPQISVSGLGDYDRASGYTDGSVKLEWKTATFNYDRGTKISVDVMDDHSVVFRKFWIGILEFFDLLWIKHMDFLVKPTQSTVFAKKANKVISINRSSFKPQNNV